jgi:hypothetical protein
MTATYSLDKFIDGLIDEAEYELGQPSEDIRLTKLELAKLCAEALDGMVRIHCAWCGVDTVEIDEWYMVTDTIWNTYGPADGCACIGCLVARMGRQLQPDDFKDVPLNTGEDHDRSERLRNRLGRDATLFDADALAALR